MARNVSTPPFGLLSGISSFLGFLPHFVFLTFITFVMGHSLTLMFLIVSSLFAKLCGECIFWRLLFPGRMDAQKGLEKWRSSIDKSFFLYPDVHISLVMMVADWYIDVSLVRVALKTAIAPSYIFLILLGCQALSSPIQGFLSDYYNRSKSIVFAAFIGIAVLIFCNAVLANGEAGDMSASRFKLYSLSSSNPILQIILILIGKGVFSNLAVLARASIAEVIKIKTQRDLVTE